MITKLKSLLICVSFLYSVASFSQVSISDKIDQTADPSAVLELISDDKGFLLPRMNSSDRGSIDSPAESLMIFNTETKCIDIYIQGDWYEFWCKSELIGSQVKFTTPGTHLWTVPDTVTSVSVVCVGAGGGGGSSNVGSGGGGGALAWKNNIPVTPGSNCTVIVGAGGTGAIYSSSTQPTDGEDSSFTNGVITLTAGGGGAGRTATASWTGNVGGVPSGHDGGGNGGNGGYYNYSDPGAYGGGGGAGGYSGDGGKGGDNTVFGVGNGGAGAGGSGTLNPIQTGGGGVGLYGEGASGVNEGEGGSGGTDGEGNDSYPSIAGGIYGGGGSAVHLIHADGTNVGAPGACRIIWPGNERQFPSTRTADE